MIIIGKNFQAQSGREDVVYVNLGNGQGVKVGDYFRIFRYTGTQHETVFQDPRYAFDQNDQLSVPFFPLYGFGSVSQEIRLEQHSAGRRWRGSRAANRPELLDGPDHVQLARDLAGDYVEVE